MGDMLTISDLRQILGQPAHIIDYALDRYGPAPRGRAGMARVWSRKDLPRIRESLKRTAERSTARGRKKAAKLAMA